jgi:hypothetical protein
MRAWVRRGRTVVTAVLMACGCARSALAQMPQRGSVPDASPAPDPSHDSTRTVDVTIVAGGDDTDPLLGTVRELLGRLGLGVNPHLVAVGSPGSEAGGPPSGPSGLSVWIDLASRYEARTIVRRGSTEVRRTIARDSSPAIVREEIGEAVRSGVEAELLTDAPTTPTPPVASAAPPAPSPVAAETSMPLAASDRWFALDLTIFAGGGPVAGNSAVVTRIGGGAVIGSRRRLRPSLTVTAAYFVPFSTALSGVMMETTFVSVRAVPAIEIVHTSWLGVNVGVGGGVDVISVNPSASSSATGIRFTPPASRVDPILTALATAYMALAPGVAFTVVVGTDVDFVPPEYRVGGAQGGDILTPWRVQPLALAGFTFTAVGKELFAARTP